MVARLEPTPHSVWNASNSHDAAAFLTVTFGECAWPLCLWTPSFVYAKESAPLNASSVRDTARLCYGKSRAESQVVIMEVSVFTPTILCGSSEQRELLRASGIVPGTMNLLEQME